MSLAEKEFPPVPLRRQPEDFPDTPALQAALEEAARTGEALRLGPGLYEHGPLRLPSGLHLVLEPGAVLRARPDPDLYEALDPPTDNGQLWNCRRAFLYAEAPRGLTLEGGGRIEGPGEACGGFGVPESQRPMTLFVVGGTDLRVENLHFDRAAMWSVVFMECSRLVFRGNTVCSTGITRDGLDLVDCGQVLVEDCRFDTGDDAVCLKTHSPRGLRDITVRRCRLRSFTNAVKLGTPTYGPVEDLLFEDLVIVGTRYAALAVEVLDGSAARRITARRISVRESGAAFFVLAGGRNSTWAGATVPVGQLEDLVFEDWEATGLSGSWGHLISGTLRPEGRWVPRRIRLSRLRLVWAPGPVPAQIPPEPPEYAGQYPDCHLWGDLPAAGLWIRHAEEVTLEDCRFETRSGDPRPALVRPSPDA